MGNVAKRANGKWLARYRDDARKEHAKSFDTKRDAQRWLDEVTTSQLIGQYVDPRNAKMTLGAYAELWQAGKIHRDQTTAQLTSTLKVHILPRFGDRPIGSIRRTEIQSWVAEMSRTSKPNTVRNNFGRLFGILESAVVDRVIGSNPAKGIDLPAPTGQVADVLTTDVVLEIERKTPERYRALVRLMAGTGLRAGEATGVTVDRVDFLRRELKVDRQLLARHPSVFGPLKTKASYRTIPLPQTVVDALAAHIAAYGVGPEGVLFTTPRGGVFNRDAFGKVMRNAFTRAKAPAWATPHDLRHYYASLLIAHGENVKVVQERLGHGSAKVTLDTYSHLWPGQDDTTRSAIDDVLGARADQLRTEDNQKKA